MSTDGYSESRSNSGFLTRSRKFRRTGYDRLPFIPYGLVPLVFLGLLTLFALFIFARGSVQQPAEAAAQQALSEIGATWATPRVSGQWVTLEGRPPSREAAAAAISAVNDARARTPFGRAIPVTRVRDRFTYAALPSDTAVGPVDADPVASEPDIAPNASAPAADTSAPAEVPTGIGSPDWSFELNEGVLRLDGESPDSATRTMLMSLARSQIDPPRVASVDDSLLVTGADAPEGFQTVARRGIQTVSQCDRGIASMTGGVFSLICELPETDANNVEALAIAPLPYGRLGTINVLSNERVSACEADLADLLNATKIEFASSSALIDAASSNLLDEVAAAAQTCPGTLRIEGHTDNTGRVAFNADLSSRRAQAVRAALIRRGVSESRLTAQGYGSTRPIADNDTETGRARNRRIEIRVVRATD